MQTAFDTNVAEDPVNMALYGFMGSGILFHGHRLGLYRELAAAPGGVAPDTLAQRLGLEQDTLRRVLGGAMAWNLVGQGAHGYVLTPEAQRSLDPASPQYLGPLLEHFASNTQPLFEHLDAALASGQAQWSQLALEAQAPFEYLEAEERGSAFHDAMWSLSHQPSEELVGLGLLDGVDSIVDLGGGVGAFAIAAVRRHPGLRATVFDLPAVERHCLARVQGMELLDQVGFVAGDFWDSPLPKAQAYALGFILSDWDDEQSLTLLRRVREALPENGRVLVLDRLLEASGAAPFNAVMQDLAMLLETGGRHRTAEQFEALLRAAGFSRTQVTRGSGEKHAVIGFV